MTIKIKYSGDATLYEPNDYIVAPITVPFTTRNEDYSLNTRGFELTLSEKYNYEGHTKEDIERIIVNDGDLYFYGIYIDSSHDYAMHVDKITFFNELEKLKEYTLNKYHFDPFIINTTDGLKYNPNDASLGSVTSASILWIFQNMFSIVGLSDPMGLIDTKLLFPSIGSQTNIEFEELKVDMGMFYNINQNIALRPEDWEFEEEWEVDNQLTYFDIVSWFCSNLGLTIIGTSSGYKLDIYNEDSYNPSGAGVESYELKNSLGNRETVYWEIRANEDILNYYNGVVNPLTEIYTTKPRDGGNSKQWYPNLMFTAVDRSYNGTADEGSMLELYQYYVRPQQDMFIGSVSEKVREVFEDEYQKRFVKYLFETGLWKNIISLKVYKSQIEKFAIIEEKI